MRQSIFLLVFAAWARQSVFFDAFLLTPLLGFCQLLVLLLGKDKQITGKSLSTKDLG